MKLTFLILFILCSKVVFSLPQLPVIKATSKTVDIRDGDYLEKSSWTLSPLAKPDVYVAYRTRKTKWVTFYTDIDSIRMKVTPGSVTNFVILLNGKDSCFTQVRSAISKEVLERKKTEQHDTIPFILTRNSAIQVMAIVNNRDTLNLHFDLGSFNFRLTKTAVSTRTKLLPTGTTAEPDFSSMEKIESIRLNKLTIQHPQVGLSNFTASGMDGRFGWNLFEGKVVEIDYDQSCIIVHSSLPSGLAKRGFSKSPIEFNHSFVCLKGHVRVGNNLHPGLFLLDTGSDLAIVLDSAWVRKQHFKQEFTLLKTMSFKDPTGTTYVNKLVNLPAMEINGVRLDSIPTTLLGSNSPLDFEVNYLGNEVLKRFNLLLDFSQDVLYLKPNSLFKNDFNRF